jgi:hypothetical protein
MQESNFSVLSKRDVPVLNFIRIISLDGIEPGVEVRNDDPRLFGTTRLQQSNKVSNHFSGDRLIRLVVFCGSRKSSTLA